MVGKVAYKVILVKQNEKKVKHFEEMKKENKFLSAFPDDKIHKKRKLFSMNLMLCRT